MSDIYRVTNASTTLPVRLLSTIFALALIAGGASPALAEGHTGAEQRRGAPHVTAELLVKFKPSVSAPARGVPGSIGDVRSQGPRGVQRVKLAEGVSLEEALAALKGDSNVLYAEPNHIFAATATTPNDPNYPSQWGLEKIDGPAVWSEQTGSADVVVAVVDTGVEATHPALSSNMWVNADEIPSNGVDDDRNGFVDDHGGWDVAGNDNDPSDTLGHGTHVAGIAAAAGNDGIGTSGTTWDAAIMPVRALDDSGMGTTFGIAKAIDYAVDNGARIVNLSLGGDGYSETLSTAITSAKQTLFVVSAGNGGSDGVGDDTSVAPSFPCNMPAENLICVAASDSSDALASFSNYGTMVDLAAPGKTILSTYPGGRYSYASGTSMATPFVAGAAALLWAEKPTATSTEIRSAILKGVEASSALQGKIATGGRLHLPGALRQISPAAVVEPEPQPEPEPTPTEEPSPSPTPTDGGDTGSGGGGTLPLPEASLTPLPLEPSPTPTEEPTAEPSPTPTEEPTPEPDPDPSPEPEPEVAPSELSLSLEKRRYAIKVSGLLQPGLEGSVDVILARKKDGTFKRIARRNVSLNVLSQDASVFRAKFDRPKRGRCKVMAIFSDGNVTTKAVRRFKC